MCCAFLVSGLVLWFLRRSPHCPLTEEDMNIYVIGKGLLVFGLRYPRKKAMVLSEGKEKKRRKYNR